VPRHKFDRRMGRKLNLYVRGTGGRIRGGKKEKEIKEAAADRGMKALKEIEKREAW